MEFHLTECICCKSWRVEKNSMRSSIIPTRYQTVLRFQVLDRHGKKKNLRHTWGALHKCISSGWEKKERIKVFLGHSAITVLTYSRAQGWNHQWQVVGEKCREMFARRERRVPTGERGELSDTLNLTHTHGGAQSKFQNLTNLSAPRQIH